MISERSADSMMLERSQQHPRQVGDRCHKAGVLAVFCSPSHPEVNDRPAATTREAMPVVPVPAHAEARAPIVMEGTEAPAFLIQFHVATHELKHSDRVLDAC